MPAIEVLIGNIASGKSTYALKRAREGWIVVNDDAIVLAVHGGDYRLYDEENFPLYKSVETTIVYTAIAMGKSVVVDRSHDVKPKARKRWIAIGSSLEVPVHALVFPFATPVEHATRRFKAGGRDLLYADWLVVANRRHNEYVMPMVHEGFSEVICMKEE